MKDVDLLIVGAGPAGCAAALNVARLAPSLARSTLVLERCEHPRHKLCGGGVVPDVDTQLTNLGLDLREVPSVDVSRAQLHFAGRGFALQLRDIAFHVVRRREFDAWLADRVRDAGVELHTRTHVTGMRRIDGGWLVDTTRGVIRARAVIGADGTKGLTRRQLPGDAGSVARVVEVIVPPPRGPAPGPLPPDDEALFEFRNVPAGVQGYFWSFPMQIDGRPMRNLGVYDSRILDHAPLAGSLKGFLADELTRHGLRLSDCKIEGHPIHLFSPRSVLSAPHILLAGDAAGVDPLLGEGISLALGYGELAARAVIAGLDRNNLDFADYTRDVHASPMGRSLRFRHRAASLVYRLQHPLLQRLVWWHLRPLVRRFIHSVVFNWARPGAPPPTRLRRQLPADAAA